MSKPVRPFLGESADARVKHRRDLFLKKAFEYMANNAWQQVSIAQLCRDVNLNKRYFYESFSGLAELENAVVNDLTGELLSIGFQASSEASSQQLTTEELAKFTLHACVSWIYQDPRKARVIFNKAADNPQARSHRDNVIEQMSQALASFGFEYHKPKAPELKITEAHQNIARLCSAVLIGGTIESILLWLDGKISLELDDFVNYIAQFWVALGDTATQIAIHEKADPNQGDRE